MDRRVPQIHNRWWSVGIVAVVAGGVVFLLTYSTPSATSSSHGHRASAVSGRTVAHDAPPVAVPTAATSSPDVPAQIPAGGVGIGTCPGGPDFLLFPPTGTPAITADQAVADAKAIPNQFGVPPSVVLADVTVPGSLPPPGDTRQWDSVDNELAWVVTTTDAYPENAAAVSEGPGAPPPGTHWPDPLPATAFCPETIDHMNWVVDAQTGKIRRGFETQ